jgi:hypothetical protein
MADDGLVVKPTQLLVDRLSWFDLELAAALAGATDHDGLVGHHGVPPVVDADQAADVVHWCLVRRKMQGVAPGKCPPRSDSPSEANSTPETNFLRDANRPRSWEPVDFASDPPPGWSDDGGA